MSESTNKMTTGLSQAYVMYDKKKFFCFKEELEWWCDHTSCFRILHWGACHTWGKRNWKTVRKNQNLQYSLLWNSYHFATFNWLTKKKHAYKHEVKVSFVRDDLTVLRNASCQDNLQILPETTFSLVKEKNWNQANGWATSQFKNKTKSLLDPEKF